MANTNRRTILSFVAWAYSIIVAIAGIVGIATGDVVTGSLNLLSAIIVFPVSAQLVERQFNISVPGWARVAGAIALLIAAGAMLPPTKPSPIAQRTEAAFVPEQRGIAMAKLLFLDDFNGYLLGRKVVGGWSSLVPLGERISARQLYISYNDNEVAADDRFKGKTIAVTGEIDKISKDIFNSVYLMLDAGGEFHDVQAFLAEESAARAGTFPRGKTVTLVCKGEGMILLSPILKECQTTDVLFSMQRSTVEQEVDSTFSGGDTDLPEKTKLLIGYSYALGTLMPRSNACETATPEKMDACSTAMHLVSKDAIRAGYVALAKQIKLPPLPVR